jgi:uncharacterized protein (DUF1778 family)
MRGKPQTHIYFETKAQLALIRRAADLEDKSVQRFCLRAIVKAAQQTISEAHKPEPVSA